jgi:hypothetical protein
MDNPVPIASALSGQISGQLAINNPNTVPVLLRGLAIELVSLRRGEYELPPKK